MLKNTLFKEAVISKGYSYKEVSKDIIRFLIEKGDIYLIGLYIATNNYIDFSKLDLLLECAINNANENNIEDLILLKQTMLSKPFLIVYEFTDKIKQMERIIKKQSVINPKESKKC